MANRFCIICTALWMWAGVGLSRTTVTIGGQVTDAATGTPLEFVTVSHTVSGLWAQTDAKGAFQLRGLPTGVVMLEVRIVG